MENKPCEYDLFNNPTVDAARAAMSQEDIDRYKALGEEMFKVDFTKDDPTSIVDGNEDTILYILESVKSGQHPSTLNDNEKEFLKEYSGEKWYEKFGYTEEDLICIR
jgi:hypothetical protein